MSRQLLRLPSCVLLAGIIGYALTTTRVAADIIDDHVKIDSAGYIVIDAQRVGRTVKQYILRATATNVSDTTFRNVTASLVSWPDNVTVVDGVVSFGTFGANSTVTSADRLTIQMDLRVATSLDDLVWQVEGEPPAPPAGGGGGSEPPQRTGIFMNVDGGAIQGEDFGGGTSEWIELLSFSEASSRSLTTTDGGSKSTITLQLDGVDITKLVDAASVPLRQAVADGDIFNEIEIVVTAACNGKLYTRYAITMTAPVFTSLAASGNTGAAPSEQLSLDYVRIESMYTPIDQSCKLQSPVFSFQDARGI